MVLCFVPGCVHKSEIQKCKMFRFPTPEKKKALWIKLIRRADRAPSQHSRVCSCHFEEGKDYPTIFERNKDHLKPFKETGNVVQRIRKRCVPDEIADFEEENKILKDLLSKKERENDVLKKGLAEKEAVTSSLKENLQAKELENAKLKECLSKNEKEIALLKIKLKDEKEHNMIMRNLIEIKEEEKKNIEKDLGKLEEENSKMKCALEETEWEIIFRREARS